MIYMQHSNKSAFCIVCIYRVLNCVWCSSNTAPDCTGSDTLVTLVSLAAAWRSNYIILVVTSE